MKKRKDATTVFNFDALSSDFVLAKPLQQGSFDEQVIYELERAGDLIITRKRDGWKIFALKNNGRVKIYTDGINEVDERIDHVRHELARTLPDKTLLVGECVVDVHGHDAFTKVGSYMSKRSSEWRELQQEVGKVKFMIFGVIFWNGEPWISRPYDEQIGLIHRVSKTLQHVIPVPVLQTSYDEAKRIVRENNWEGLVLYAKKFVSSFRLDGKSPARPKGCYKWKPIFEDDFVVRKWMPSDEDPDRLKELVLLQIDPEDRREFYCGKIGSFTESLRSTLRHLPYPIVVQIEFEARYESGTVRNARFLRVRGDKKPQDCIAPKHFGKAKYDREDAS